MLEGGRNAREEEEDAGLANEGEMSLNYKAEQPKK
jgi:hypothetical protein